MTEEPKRPGYYPQYAHQWTRGLYMGSGSPHSNGDPREELKYWADRAEGPMVSVPVATLRAAVAVRVCRATTISTGDEDGPMEPSTLHCSRPHDHPDNHSNGYASWARER